MERIARCKAMFLGSAAVLALSVPAGAQTIDTIPQWNGTSFISSWGITNTATYGQTFTPNGVQTTLNGFTVKVGYGTADAPYQAYVYAWDGGNSRLTGGALFTSAPGVATQGAGFTSYSFNTGPVALTPGQQYVVFLSTSGLQAAQPNSAFRWGALTNDAAIPGGRFVFQNNGDNFANLSTVGWSFISEDLAITLNLSGLFSNLLPANAPINPTNVAGAIDRAGALGALPAGFNALSFMTTPQFLDALGQISGENHTQAQQGAFQLGNLYLSLLTDPMSTNKVATTAPLGYAPEKKLPAGVAAANAMFTKAPPIVYAPRWDVWGAAFGGANTTRGDAVVVGSHDAYTRVGGVAAGADYRYAPNSMIGFSLAGGNINWSTTGGSAIAGCCGGGASESFMAGIYGKHDFGAGYVSGALAYSNYWMRADRTVTIAGLDRLHAEFDAQGIGGRLEGGWRAGQYWNVNWTPYAAFQGQSFHTPNYGEVAVTGSNQFALNFTSRTATAYRGELGVRTDKVMAVDNGGQLNLFGKFAYARDEITNPQANATFAAIGPVAGFTVFGARPSRDLALTTAGAEWRLTNGISFLTKFDGEFGDRSQTYSGTGRIRYTW